MNANDNNSHLDLDLDTISQDITDENDYQLQCIELSNHKPMLSH